MTHLEHHTEPVPQTCDDEDKQILKIQQTEQTLQKYGILLGSGAAGCLISKGLYKEVNNSVQVTKSNNDQIAVLKSWDDSKVELIDRPTHPAAITEINTTHKQPPNTAEKNAHQDISVMPFVLLAAGITGLFYKGYTFDNNKTVDPMFQHMARYIVGKQNLNKTRDQERKTKHDHKNDTPKIF